MTAIEEYKFENLIVDILHLTGIIIIKTIETVINIIISIIHCTIGFIIGFLIAELLFDD